MSNDDPELEKIRKRKLKELLRYSSQKTEETVKKEPVRSEIINLTDQNFDHIISSTEKLILIDFWADWCYPCKMMAVPFHNLSYKYPQVQFCKLNTEQNRRTALRLNVQSIPRFIFFKNGRPVHQVVGAIGEMGLDREIQRMLAIYPS